MSTNPIDQGSVTLSRNAAVATITFSHPLSNSLPGKLLDLLATTITEEGLSNESKVMVLKSGGDRAFCGGASFDELAAIDNDKNGLQFFSGFAKVINAMRTCPKFIIGRVHGKAVGGGVGIASATDYCFATQFASVKLSELAVGIGPFVVGPAVERKIGSNAMSQLAIDATNFRTASWAATNGLYAEVFDDVEALDAGVERLTNSLSGQSMDAMKALKKVFWQGTDHWGELLLERAAISGSLVLRPEAKSAIAHIKSQLGG